MPRRHGKPIEVAGWVGGVLENIPAESSMPGALESALNILKKPGTKLATRGGSRTMLAFDDGELTPADMSDMLFVRPFSQTGVVAIGWKTGTPNGSHWAFLAASDLASQGVVEELAAWAGPAARPLAVEMFENVYICDTNPVYGDREPLLQLTGAGTATAIQQQFPPGSSGSMYPRVIEEFAGVLFAAGFDGSTVGQERAILRHSFLARSPSASDGWSGDGWALIGAKGKEITALKAGRNVLLVAKVDALYRVYGSPLALDGWQFAIEALDFGVGYGVTNPYALEYWNGWWYGVGDSGPWRTDGSTIENLADRRRDSWDGLNADLSLAWVSAHPERGIVLFGMKPDTLWVWDTAAEAWMGDWVFPGTTIAYGSAVVSTESVGPVGPPTAPASSSVTGTGWTADITTGDALALTEWWVRQRGDVGNGTDTIWQLHDTTGQGVEQYVFTGMQGYTHYQWKARHVKQGFASAFTTETSVYTDIVAPTWVDAVGISDTLLKVRLRVIQNSISSDIKFQRRTVSSACGSPGAWTDAITTTDWPGGPLTVYDEFAACGIYYQYQARAQDASWPGDGKTSAYVQCTTPTCTQACAGTGGEGGGPPIPPIEW